MIDILRSLFSALLYGYMENRLFKVLKFKKQSDTWLFDHFQTYHVFMALLFIVISFSTNLRIWLLNMIMMPFVQDFTWFLFEGRKPNRNDWSNWLPFYRGKPPLFHGLFIWYWLSVITIALLGLSLVLFR